MSIDGKIAKPSPEMNEDGLVKPPTLAYEAEWKMAATRQHQIDLDHEQEAVKAERERLIMWLSQWDSPNTSSPPQPMNPRAVILIKKIREGKP